MISITFCTVQKKFYKKEFDEGTTIEEVKRILNEDIFQSEIKYIKMIYEKKVLVYKW